MEMRCAQRRLAARRLALWLHFRGHPAPAHDRQRPQPRHGLLFDARQRVAAAQAQFRALAVAGQFHSRWPAESQPERIQRHSEMSDRAPSAAGLMQQRPFVLFWLARLASTMGYQMLALTIGWQVYEITNSAFALGLVGLIQFVPAVILTLLIGHAADRYDRRLIVRAAHCVYALAAI